VICPVQFTRDLSAQKLAAILEFDKPGIRKRRRSGADVETTFRHRLAGTTITVHEHLNGEVSIRFGPHVLARFTAAGEAITNKPERGGKGGLMGTGENQKQVSTASHKPLAIAPTPRDCHFPTARLRFLFSK
jgi:hypothetical protein